VPRVVSHQPQEGRERSAPRTIAIWWLACLLWSGGWLFIKIGVQDVPPLTFAAARLWLASLVLLPIIVAQGEWRRLTRADIMPIAWSGVLLLGVNYALVFWGAQFVPSGLTALLQATSPLFAFALGLLRGSELFAWGRAAGIVLGLVGVALISGSEFRVDERAGAGSIAIMIGAACAAVAYTIVKGRARHVPAMVLVGGQTACALALLAPAALGLDGNPLSMHWTPRALMALAYLGIGSSVVAFWLNYWLLQRMDATTVLSSALVQPLIAALLGGIVLGERLGTPTIAGGALILAGAAAILRRSSSAGRRV
jgi:drug/metabolite transporter (DMT)-like permease